MILGKLKERFSKEEKIEKIVEKIQQGEKHLLRDLATNYQPFILKKCSEVRRRQITIHDEEFSIALIAFNEAVEKYSFNKNGSFLSFASLVMKSRIIDYLRKEMKNSNNYSFDEKEENTENSYEVRVAKEQQQKDYFNMQRAEEIEHLGARLKEFKITFEDLVESSPKHKDARINSFKMAKELANNEILLAELMKTKRLPMNELEKIVNMSRKTIERNRKFIIATTIILSGDYIYIREFLKGVENQ